MKTASQSIASEIASVIKPPSEQWLARAREHLDTLTKPLGSLGRLEDLAAQIVAIRQERFGERVSKAVYVFAADHGVTAEGVSAYPREVTHQMVLNFLAQGAAINVLAHLHGVDLQVVDVGVDTDFDPAPCLLQRKIARGTRNMLRALLIALLETLLIRSAEAAGDFTMRLALQEESKTLPFGAVWDYYCETQNVSVGDRWLNAVKSYEKNVLSKRN